MKTSKNFTIKNNFFYTSSKFLELFGDMEVKIPKKIPFETMTLETSMLDKDILEKFKPEEITLSDLAYYVKNKLDKKEWYLCYIRDSKNTLWAVGVGWCGGGWRVSAGSVGGPSDWLGGDRVFSRRFLDTQTLSPSLPDELILNGKKYKAVYNHP